MLDSLPSDDCVAARVAADAPLTLSVVVPVADDSLSIVDVQHFVVEAVIANRFVGSVVQTFPLNGQSSVQLYWFGQLGKCQHGLGATRLPQNHRWVIVSVKQPASNLDEC